MKGGRGWGESGVEIIILSTNAVWGGRFVITSEFELKSSFEITRLSILSQSFPVVSK